MSYNIYIIILYLFVVKIYELKISELKISELKKVIFYMQYRVAISSILMSMG